MGDYDKAMVADALYNLADAITSGELDGAGRYAPSALVEQADMLIKAYNADAAGVHTATQPPAVGVDVSALRNARDEGHDAAIRYVLGYLNGAGDCGGTMYEEILRGCGAERIIASARDAGEMRFTGLDRYLRQERTTAALRTGGGA